jgi:hypothetical protein
MKSVLPYILLMTGTLVASLAVIAAIYYLKPGLLGIAPKPVPVAAQKDSVAGKPPVAAAVGDSSAAKKQDSTFVGPPAPPASKPDEAAISADSIRTLLNKIGEQQKMIVALSGKSSRGPQSDSTAHGTVSDSARAKESKSFAKMLEGMPAEQAVRILKGLDDREVKAVLLTVKKRQAAKILSALDPDRAARMMRTLQ